VAADAAVEAVIAAGARSASRNWTPATAGNFSARVDAKRIAVSRSGVDKGAMTSADVTVISLARPRAPGISAEAPLHVALYKAHPEVAHVWHVHSPAAVVISRLAEDDGQVWLRGWELQKVLGGVRSHEETVVIPVLPNDQDTERLAAAAMLRLAAPVRGAIMAPGYLIAGHGLYAWGGSPEEAWRRVEALETMLAHQLEFDRRR
jgi:methylthioribulose-1-phosphate dehydratase